MSQSCSTVDGALQDLTGRLRRASDLLDEDLPQAALSKGVVLQIEAVKTMEGLLASVHVQSVHIQVVPT